MSPTETTRHRLSNGGGAAVYWSPERRFRRRQAAAGDGLRRIDALEEEGRGGDVQMDGELTSKVMPWTARWRRDGVYGEEIG